MRLMMEMISYPFIVRALVGGMMVSLCAALLGVTLVLKRYSMIGDGLSHVSFGALSIAVAFGWSPLHLAAAKPLVAVVPLTPQLARTLIGDVALGDGVGPRQGTDGGQRGHFPHRGQADDPHLRVRRKGGHYNDLG